jgi:hypothetical protein
MPPSGPSGPSIAGGLFPRRSRQPSSRTYCPSVFLKVLVNALTLFGVVLKARRMRLEHAFGLSFHRYESRSQIDERRSDLQIEIPDVVMHSLEMPTLAAGFNVQRDDCARIFVVEWSPRCTAIVRRRIAKGDIDHVGSAKNT